jgi:peroxiredoxin
MFWLLISFGMVLPWLLLLFACWLGWQILQQNGRILTRLETLETVLANGQLPGQALQQSAMPEGLEPSTEAPAIELPDLNGTPQKLADLKGRSVLVVFFNPGCGFCKEMGPALAELPPEGGDGRPVPLIVTTGSVEDNRKFFEEHKVRCRVWIQKEGEVLAKYRGYGTPSSYLIAADGTIAAPRVVGGPEALALAAPGQPQRNGHAARKGKVNKGLQHSRIARDGLKAGTPAPEFRLPRLDGGELALADYRGKKVLLVFSDPGCGPCMALAPRLEQLYRTGAVEVVLVSRGEPEANRAKVRELGLTFPVALQKHWEVSRQYALFATPVAYLIDEKGVIIHDPAVGIEPVLQMVADPPGSPRFLTNSDPAQS